MKTKGDRIIFGLRARMTSSGVTEGQTLEGSEDSLTTYSDTVILKQYRNAIRDDGELTRIRPAFDVDKESLDALKDWMTEKIDQNLIDAATASATTVFYRESGTDKYTGTAATAKAALTTTDKLTPSTLSFAKAWLMTGGNRSKTPLRPVKVGGKSYFVLLVHPDVAADLFEDPSFQQAHREARERGAENPIFTGSSFIYNGFVIHEHENVPIATDGGGASVAWAHCLILGQQALLQAYGRRPQITEKTFDYGDQHGFAVSAVMRAHKPVFNSIDFGLASLYIARTKISDA